MCRLITGTPCPDCIANVPAPKLDLCVVTHVGGGRGEDALQCREELCKSVGPNERQDAVKGLFRLL